MSEWVTGRFEGRYRALKQTGSGAAHASRFTMDIYRSFVRDLVVSETPPAGLAAAPDGDDTRVLRRDRMKAVSEAPAGSAGAGVVLDLVDIVVRDVELFDVASDGRHVVGKIRGRLVGRVAEPPPPPPPPRPQPVAAEAPTLPTAPAAPAGPFARGVATDALPLPRVARGSPSWSGFDVGWFPFSSLGCGGWLGLVFGIPLAILTFFAAVWGLGWLFHLVGDLWRLLPLPTLSPDLLPGPLQPPAQWIDRHVSVRGLVAAALAIGVIAAIARRLRRPE